MAFFSPLVVCGMLGACLFEGDHRHKQGKTKEREVGSEVGTRVGGEVGGEVGG